MRTILNIIAFQIGWFACVLGAANGLPWLGTAVVAAIVCVHLVRAPSPASETRLLLAAALIGAVFDTILAAAGLLTFTSGALGTSLTAHWMIALWLLFATTLNVSLAWLKHRPLLAFVFGLIGGPLAYVAGQELGALQLPAMSLGVIAIGNGWAAAMVLLIWLARRADPSSATARLARLA